jgi:hypothetical protein
LSPSYATPLRLERGRSLRLGAWLLLIHAGSLAVLFAPGFPAEVRGCLAAALAVSLYRTLSVHVTLTHPRAVRGLVWLQGDAWFLRLANGETHESRLCPDICALPFLVIVHLRAGDRRSFRVVLLPDMFDPESFRRLLVRLRLAQGIGS